NRKKGGLKKLYICCAASCRRSCVGAAVKSVLAWDTPVGDMHERAILTGASIDFDEDSPRSHRRISVAKSRLCDVSEMALLSRFRLFPNSRRRRYLQSDLSETWEQVMRRRIALLIAVTICLAIGALKMTAFAQPKSLKDQLIGTWILVSNVVERPDGTKVDQFGPNPKGILIFAP